MGLGWTMIGKGKAFPKGRVGVAVQRADKWVDIGLTPLRLEVPNPLDRLQRSDRVAKTVGGLSVEPIRVGVAGQSRIRVSAN